LIGSSGFSAAVCGIYKIDAIDYNAFQDVSITQEKSGECIMIKLQIQSDPKDGVIGIIQSAIAAEIKRLEIGLHKTNKNIEKLEKKYKVSSAKFQKQLTAEDMENGDQEYIEWAGELKIRKKIMTDLKKIKNIKYVTH
jgi:hypothetical protein